MKFIFIVIFLFFASVCISQVNIINRSLTDGSVNLFYLNTDNLMELSGDANTSDYNIVIKGAESQITHLGGRNYVIRLYSVVDTCVLIVYTKNGRKIFTRNYSSRVLPNAVITLGGSNNAGMRISKILEDPFLISIFPNCFYRCQYGVVSFSATFITEGDSIFTATPGNKLSFEQILIVKRLLPRDMILFDSIKIVSTDGRLTIAPPFWIKIE